MAAQADEGRDDVFEVVTSIKITNLSLGVDVSIHPSFIKEMSDDSRFVSLDFYRSRGIYALLSSRLPQQQAAAHGGRQYAKLLAKVVGDLKRKRDKAFRQSVMASAPQGVLPKVGRGDKSVLPRNRRLKAIALSAPEVVHCEMDAFEDEFDGYRLACVVPLERQNGNTELWVDSQGSTWNYLSKLVAHEYRKSLETQDEAQAPVDSSTTTPAPIETEPATPIAHSPKRQSPGDDPAIAECASPAKRQTTLLSFMTPSN